MRSLAQFAQLFASHRRHFVKQRRRHPVSMIDAAMESGIGPQRPGRTRDRGLATRLLPHEQAQFIDPIRFSLAMSSIRG